jgi:hypothetical protein
MSVEEPRTGSTGSTGEPDEPDEPVAPKIVELGPGLPGWTLRLALLLAGCAATVVQMHDGHIAVVAIVLFTLTAVTTLAPASPAPAMLIAAIAIAMAVGGSDPLRATVLVEIPLVHLVHVLASVTALVPLRSVIRPSALLRPARRFLAVQIGAFAVVGIAEILPTGRNTTFVEVVGLIAATGLVLLAVKLLTRAK